MYKSNSPAPKPNAKNEEKKKVSGKENKEKLFTASALHAVSPTENSSCVFCNKKNHKSEKCFKLLALDGQQRFDKLRELGVCFKCLNSGHISKMCKIKCAKCKGNHNVTMCGVTSPLHESRLHWIHDPHPNQPPRVTPRQAVPRNNNNSVPRNNHNTVPRNTKTVKNSDARARQTLGTIPSASWYNSNLPLPSAPSPRKNVCKPVPRNNIPQKDETIQVRNEASSSSLPPKKKRDRNHRRERRARERENNSESFIHDERWANQRSLVSGSSSVPVRVTQSVPQAVDPISSMRTAVYPPLESVGNPAANENSPFQIGLESSRNLGLYKPTAPDPDQDTWAYNLEANSRK